MENPHSNNEIPKANLTERIISLQELVARDGAMARSYLEGVRDFNAEIDAALVEAGMSADDKTCVPEWFLISGDRIYPIDRPINVESQVIVTKELEKFLRKFVTENNLEERLTTHDSSDSLECS